MKCKRSSERRVSMSTVLALVGVWLIAGAAAQATASEKVIHDFTGPDGAQPIGELIADRSGNFFGVAQTNGTSSGACPATGACGTVFELSPLPAGAWKRTVLHTFFCEKDGCDPLAGLVMDASGALYGTTYMGGPSGGDNKGIVYRLSKTAAGKWKYKILYSFLGLPDGQHPRCRLTFDKAGNLYGTTESGGTFTAGTAFELSPTASGFWLETVIFDFAVNSRGALPKAGAVFDAAGNLYGTTGSGGNTGGACGSLGCGVVYEITPSTNGPWIETVLHSFSGADGGTPYAGVTFDAAGNLLGSTYIGGDLSGCGGNGCGVIYKLSPSYGGVWTETLLHAFQPGTSSFAGAGGGNPYSGPTEDAAGNLYGTAATGGRGPGYFGVVYKLAPVSGGWKETVLHAFYGGTDGGEPLSGVTLDATGNLFGTTYLSGILSDCLGNGCGVVYEITP